MTHPDCLPHGSITEVFDNIFFVSGQSCPNFEGQVWQMSRNMTVIRQGDELTLVNTLRLNDEGLAELDKLGKVKHVLRLGAFHGRDDAFYVDRYQAELWAPEGVEDEHGATVTQAFGADTKPPIDGASFFFFETSKMPEVLLQLDRDGGIVLSCDALQNWHEVDEHFSEETAAMMTQIGFIKANNIGPGWLRYSQPEPRDFERLLKLKFEHMLGAHGAPVKGDASDKYAKTVAAMPSA